jgi:hypothetical protein
MSTPLTTTDALAVATRRTGGYTPTASEEIDVMLEMAFTETISAMSSLNMVPCPMEVDPALIEQGVPIYLTDSDAWCRHAAEHIRACQDLIASAQHRLAHRETIRRSFGKPPRKEVRDA